MIWCASVRAGIVAVRAVAQNDVRRSSTSSAQFDDAPFGRSNRIYQRVGFEPVGDRLFVEF